MTALLVLDNLHVHFVSRGLDNRVRVAKALNGVSFILERGEVLGLVGETGAGKSLTALAVMGLLRPPARAVAGRILFDGRPLHPTDPEGGDGIRGSGIALVPQSPRTSLDPLATVGAQLVRMQREHARRVGIARPAASTMQSRALEMLRAVRIPEPERRMNAYPHELSGGMAQRVLIAMALVNGPRLLVADEPTTGLDVTVQAEILDTLRTVVRERGMSAMIITHDLGIVAHFCDRMALMFAGTVVEQGRVAPVFGDPRHPYTRALIAATPRRIAARGFAETGGTPPDLYALPTGCLYRERCPRATAECTVVPPVVMLPDGREARCHHAFESAGPL